jgi:hypothetical protein
MATRTITRLYDSYDEAARVVRDLEAAGVPHDDISVAGSHHGGSPGETRVGEEDTGARTGVAATFGTVLGGSGGLPAGIVSFFTAASARLPLQRMATP